MTDIAIEAAEPIPAKPRRRGRKLLLVLIALLVIGGGAAGGYYAMSGGSGGHEEAEADHPELVVREGVDEAAAERGRRAARTGRPDPRLFKATYLPLEGNFTSNLRGGDAFVQIGVGISTFYDERVVEHVHRHEMAIRSAILMTLSEADPFEITTLSGKQALKEALKNAINNVLTDREGFGGIDDVYFTSFVTQ